MVGGLALSPAMANYGHGRRADGRGLGRGLTLVKRVQVLNTLCRLPTGEGLNREAVGLCEGRSCPIVGRSRVTALVVCPARMPILPRRLCRNGPKIGRSDARGEITTAGEGSPPPASVAGRNGMAKMVSDRGRP